MQSFFTNRGKLSSHIGRIHLPEQLLFLSVNERAGCKSAMGQIQLMDRELDYACPDKQKSKQEIEDYVFSV